MESQNSKLVDGCYDDTYAFSKHTTMTRSNFLYLIGMIGQTIPHVKIVFVHLNVFAIILGIYN